jgi:PDDEXK-like domain of unknown function (DUF3799)
VNPLTARLIACTAAEYHADPVTPGPSLSASIAHRLLSQSPHHAWWNHPKLNPAFEPEVSGAFDLGTAAHALLLEGQGPFAVIEADDYRSAAAKMAREVARAAGRIPLLRDQWPAVQAMVDMCHVQLAHHQATPAPFTAGKPEQTIIWTEDMGRITCRARLDWLADDYKTIDDYKTVSGSANPMVWTRNTIWALGHDVQAAFYCRAVKALTGIEPEFRFVVQETFAPYALSVIGLMPSAMAMARRKVEQAIGIWNECVNAGTWPGYVREVAYAEAPPWELAKLEERAYWQQQQAGDPDEGIDKL